MKTLLAILIYLWNLIRDPLERQLASQKFWTTVIGITATELAKHNVILDASMAPYIAGGFALLLGGQAAADHGKAAAQIHADSMNAPPPPTEADKAALAPPAP